LIAPGIDFHGLLGAILSRSTHSPHPPDACPRCGKTLEESIERGLLGCSNCYERFSDDVAPVILESQGRDRHVGKSPHK